MKCMYILLSNVFRYTLKNSKGTEIYILNYGGIIRKIVVPDKNGKMDDICLGFDGMEGRC